MSLHCPLTPTLQTLLNKRHLDLSPCIFIIIETETGDGQASVCVTVLSNNLSIRYGIKWYQFSGNTRNNLIFFYVRFVIACFFFLMFLHLLSFLPCLTHYFSKCLIVWSTYIDSLSCFLTLALIWWFGMLCLTKCYYIFHCLHNLLESNGG